MGIAIAIVYIPTLFILTGLSLWLSSRIRVKHLADRASCGFGNLYFGLLVLATVGIVTASLFLINHKNNTDFEALFTQIAITLLGPFFLAGISSWLASYFSYAKKPKCLPLWFRFYAAAALHAVWLFPVIALGYLFTVHELL